jgi:Kef-type K+ transport system membrane component KefB
MKRGLILHLILLGLVTCILWIIFASDKKDRPPEKQIPLTGTSITKETEGNYNQVATAKEILKIQVFRNIKNPTGLLFLQLIIILAVAKLFGSFGSKLRQPKVIGEMIAGIILGPSFLGLVSPEIFNFLFPENSLGNLQIISQLGVIFFMFIVGMELDIGRLKSKVLNAFTISNASFIFPFFLGVLLSFSLFDRFAPENVRFSEFALFIGIAISITAFPVLAKILQERNLTKTTLGTIAITCAAFNDLTSWCALGLVIAITIGEDIYGVLLIIFLTILFIIIMFYILRPLLRKINLNPPDGKNHHKTYTIIAFLILLSSACLTEAIGIHAVFGAFIAGLIIPDKMNFKETLTGKVEDITLILLLPVFFAITGLRMQIGLLNQGYLWTAFGLIVFVAMLGKIGSSAFSARITGHSWKDSLSLGVLMNTRGLIELIILNIGYDLGILSAQLFTILVLMAVTTTLMTGPLLDLIDFIYRIKTGLIKE